MLDLASVPARATRAFLRGCYRLEGETAKKAHATAWAGMVLATSLGLFVIVAALLALALL